MANHVLIQKRDWRANSGREQSQAAFGKEGTIQMRLDSFRDWCTPETILVIMRSTDEPARVLSAIKHSGGGSARVLLAQLSAQPHGSMTASFRPRRVLPWPDKLRPAAPPIQIDRAVTWSTVLSQSFFIDSVSIKDLPTLMKAFNVGRVVLTAGPAAESAAGKGIEEALLEVIDVPLWMVGPNVTPRADANSHNHRVLFPITFASDLPNSLRFACEYTRSRRGTLTLLHIFDQWAAGCLPEEKSPVAVRARLPLTALFEFGPPCGMEIAIRQGEFAQELIHFNEQRPHDVLLMDGLPSAPGFRQVVFQAECPVFLFRAASSAFAARVQCSDPVWEQMPSRQAI